MSPSNEQPLLDRLFADILHAFEFAILEQVADTQFRILGHRPAWLFRFYPDAEHSLRLSIGAHTPVLENFLADAAQAWLAKDDRMVRSGFWTEQSASEEPWHVEAIALRRGTRCFGSTNAIEDSVAPSVNSAQSWWIRNGGGRTSRPLCSSSASRPC